MNDHEDLKRALGLAVPDALPVADPMSDLERARAASRERNRRRFRAGLGGLVVLAVVGVGTTAIVADYTNGPDDSSTVATPAIQLVDKTFDATPYTFDLTPKGWSVQAQTPTAVTIVPDDGSTSSDPSVFTGKLVILFDENPVFGPAVVHDGRKIWISGNSGYTTMSTHTRDGEPAGVVRIQYPDDAGWTRPAMLDLLASVHVGPTAQPGHG